MQPPRGQAAVPGTVEAAAMSMSPKDREGGLAKTVLELAEAIGFDPVDAGPLKNVPSLELPAFLNIQLS